MRFQLLITFIVCFQYHFPIYHINLGLIFECENILESEWPLQCLIFDAGKL